jgi:hypothetical protein
MKEKDMSVKQVETAVEQFIFGEHNDLLVIKGGWGVGKTYFWQHLVQAASDKKSISKQHYCYVSLFGINSLEELKNAILAARVQSTTVSTNNGIKELIASGKQLMRDIEKIPLLREWTGGIASTTLFLFVKDTLICFDDIERKGNELNTKDLLGLASLLKEQRNCSIAFIMNDGTLSDDDDKEFRRHSEKIIDVELEFAPSPEEAFHYAFTATQLYYDFVKTCCLTLQIKNIRILQRIHRFIAALLPHLENSETMVVEDVLRSLILYVWCYYDADSDAPSIPHVKKFSAFNFYIHQEDKEQSEEVKQWNNLLRSYQYRGTNVLEQHLLSFVEKGYLDDRAFAVELDKENTEARAQQGQATYGRTWDLWKNSFDNNEQEFVQALIASFRSNSMHLSLNNLQTTVEVLRDLEQDQAASELIDSYLVQHATDLQVLDAQRSTLLMRDVKDHYLVERLHVVWQAAKEKRTLAEIVKELAASNGWSRDDIEVLAACNVEDYYDFFKSEKSDHLYFYVRTCLRFEEVAGVSEQETLIAAKAREALLRLASENRINRLRISAIYGIDANQNPPIA